MQLYIPVDNDILIMWYIYINDRLSLPYSVIAIDLFLHNSVVFRMTKTFSFQSLHEIEPKYTSIMLHCALLSTFCR